MLLLLGLMSGLWAPIALAQDAPAEVTVEETVEEDGTTVEEDGATAEEDGATAAVLADAAPEEAESPWSTGLITSMSALLIGGFSAVLGIWVDRDKSRPLAFAVVMSILITTAISVGATQSYLDAVDAIQQKEDLNRMLSMVGEIAESSGDESLIALLKSEGGPEVTITPQAEPVAEPAVPAENAAVGEPAEPANADVNP
ncbi:MAG: hypothetical protein P8R54_03030 [Myxococcota bacterium]|nr:hypothetical protein [Myxococcota bacterium]